MAGPEDLVRAAVDGGVSDERVLEAVGAVPRAGFVPADFAGRAYTDTPIPIPNGQVTTQPSLVAKMVEALGLGGDETVLEVGTGYGWPTAVLARLAGLVWSIERFHDIALAARANLARAGIANAEVVVGDGSAGLPVQAPFHAIIVSAAYYEVPGPLVTQLVPGGRLVQPIGPGGNDEVVLFEKHLGELVRRRTITGAHFVRLFGRYAYPE